MKAHSLKEQKRATHLEMRAAFIEGYLKGANDALKDSQSSPAITEERIEMLFNSWMFLRNNK